MNKKAETKQTKKVKIVKATKERGANEFGQISKVPAPFKGVNTTSTWTLPQRKKADFKKWLRHDLWRIEVAIMLLLGLEPFDVNADYWDSPPEYDDLYKLAIESQSIGTLKFHSATQVQPSVFVKWAISKGLDVPKELTALAKKPDTATIVKSEKQDTNLTQSKQESEEISTQSTTTDAQNKDKKDALAIADKLVSKDRTRSNILDDDIAIAIKNAESLKIHKVYAELWTVAQTKKSPFTGGQKDGGIAYYAYAGGTKSINKTTLEKRIDRLKKKYL